MHNVDPATSHATSERTATTDVTPAESGGCTPIATAGDDGAALRGAWKEADATIRDLSAGWFFLEGDELFEHELDVEGNADQPRPHGRFAKPEWAQVYFRNLLVDSLIMRRK